jgi:predicted O-methyltransferase YrrM
LNWALSRDNLRLFGSGHKGDSDGRLLYSLVRSTGARSIVEFGTSFGLSTLYLAAALKDTGGGQIIGSEFEATKIARARCCNRAGRCRSCAGQ